MAERRSAAQDLRDTDPQVLLISAAKAHAARIRKSLWVKRNKRLYGSRGLIAIDDDAREPHGRDSDDPLIIDGPIYSPVYWRSWQERMKTKVDQATAQ